MGKVSIVARTEAEQRSLARSGTPAAAAFHERAYSVDKLPYFPHDGEALQLFHIDLGPGAHVEPHAHTEDEIIYLLRGEIHLGARVLGPGDALYVAAHTLYSFDAGPEGASFLNFRPTHTVGYLTKEEFLARRGRP
jgi:quercetin dioxygenase-like cupin family protein